MLSVREKSPLMRIVQSRREHAHSLPPNVVLKPKVLRSLVAASYSVTTQLDTYCGGTTVVRKPPSVWRVSRAHGSTPSQPSSEVHSRLYAPAICPKESPRRSVSLHRLPPPTGSGEGMHTTFISVPAAPRSSLRPMGVSPPVASTLKLSRRSSGARSHESKDVGDGGALPPEPPPPEPPPPEPPPEPPAGTHAVGQVANRLLRTSSQLPVSELPSSLASRHVQGTVLRALTRRLATPM